MSPRLEIGTTRSDLSLHIDLSDTNLWSGVWSEKTMGYVAFSGSPEKRAAAYAHSLILGFTHYPLPTQSIACAVLWLRDRGIEVDIEDADAATLGIAATSARAES